MARETEADLYADDVAVTRPAPAAQGAVSMMTPGASAEAAAPSSSATTTKVSNDLRIIDIIHKMGIEDIQPFPIDTRNHESLEDWIYDLEEQLEQKAIQRSKWPLALRCKIRGMSIKRESLEEDYDTLRDKVLEAHGPKNPWMMMLTRLFEYQPRNIPPNKAIGDLRRLSALMERVARRKYAGRPEMLNFVVSEVLPDLFGAKIEMGIPTITKSQLLSLQAKEGPITLDDYKKCLVLNRFPFLLDWPVRHQEMRHDYTAIKPEDDAEEIPRIGAVGQTPEAVTAALNPPRATQMNSVEVTQQVAAGKPNGGGNGQRGGRNRPRGGQRQRGAGQQQGQQKKPAGTMNVCCHCHKPGHGEADCWAKHPQLRVAWEKEKQAKRATK